jgi:hypothetical protein
MLFNEFFSPSWITVRGTFLKIFKGHLQRFYGLRGQEFMNLAEAMKNRRGIKMAAETRMRGTSEGWRKQQNECPVNAGHRPLLRSGKVSLQAMGVGSYQMPCHGQYELWSGARISCLLLPSYCGTLVTSSRKRVPRAIQPITWIRFFSGEWLSFSPTLPSRRILTRHSRHEVGQVKNHDLGS